MARKIALSNQKGGVGKTTTAVNLAAGLGLNNKRVLLIDLDPQGNATTSFGIPKQQLVKGEVYDVFKKNIKLKDCMYDVKCENVTVVPSSTALAGVDALYNNNSELKEILAEEIKTIEDQFDYVIFDCPPSLGTLSVGALSICDETIIPVQTEYFALEGLTQLIVSIRLTQKTFNPNLKIGGVLLTMYDKRTSLSQEVSSEVRKYFGKTVFNAMIPRATKIAEAPSHGMSIFHFDKSSVGAQAYGDFVQEVINNE